MTDGYASAFDWSADIPAYVVLCPLSGVKRTSKSTKQLAGICAFQHAPQAQMNKGVSIALASVAFSFMQIAPKLGCAFRTHPTAIIGMK
jgi:hypothetical protein